nr:winged helix-turn-helix domain-containing protein [Yersinia hibernica]
MTHRNTGETKRLGEYQLKLLTALLQHAGKILSRDEITSLVWQRGRDANLVLVYSLPFG